MLNLFFQMMEVTGVHVLSVQVMPCFMYPSAWFDMQHFATMLLEWFFSMKIPVIFFLGHSHLAIDFV